MWLICCFVLLCGSGESLFFQPAHFPKPLYDFQKNPLSVEKVELGRRLFYDPILSADGSISCASCHSPYNAFAHTDHDLSHGIYDQIGTRNAPALFNLAWQRSFMWDGAVNHLDVQALAPITHPKEMGETLPQVLKKLRQDAFYPKLFQEAWGDSSISGEHLLKSLSQFQLTLISAGSRYDQVKLGKARFTPQESKGYLLFKQHCHRCHTEPLFTREGFFNNGLPPDSTLNDPGRGKISGLSADSLRFKIPSLRNLSYTPPYMHDGRFRKIREVLNHYSDGMLSTGTIDPELKTGLKMSADEKTDLTAFLLTLNDSTFVFDIRYTDPARKK